MSWNQIELSDLEIKVRDICIDLTWTCPRCDHTQIAKTSIPDLLCGQNIECEDVDVCGFELSLDVILGSYKGLNDRPLNKI